MFQHAGFRSLWPVILLLPWFYVGVAYLLTAMLHGKKEVAPLSLSSSKPSRRATC
jgi:hypothetical protein